MECWGRSNLYGARSRGRSRGHRATSRPDRLGTLEANFLSKLCAGSTNPHRTPSLERLFPARIPEVPRSGVRAGYARRKRERQAQTAWTLPGAILLTPPPSLSCAWPVSFLSATGATSADASRCYSRHRHRRGLAGQLWMSSERLRSTSFDTEHVQTDSCLCGHT